MKWNEASVELEVRSTPESVGGAGGGAALWEGGALLSGLLFLLIVERVDSLVLWEKDELLAIDGCVI